MRALPDRTGPGRQQTSLPQVRAGVVVLGSDEMRLGQVGMQSRLGTRRSSPFPPAPHTDLQPRRRLRAGPVRCPATARDERRSRRYSAGPGLAPRFQAGCWILRLQRAVAVFRHADMSARLSTSGKQPCPEPSRGGPASQSTYACHAASVDAPAGASATRRRATGSTARLSAFSQRAKMPRHLVNQPGRAHLSVHGAEQLCLGPLLLWHLVTQGAAPNGRLPYPARWTDPGHQVWRGMGRRAEARTRGLTATQRSSRLAKQLA